MARNSSRGIVGLDIEPGFAAAAEVSVNGQLSIERGVFAPLAPQVMAGGDVTDVNALSAALRELFDTAGLPRRVRVGLASARVAVRVLELPVKLEGKDLDAAVRFQAADEMPIPIDQAVLDHHPLGVVQTADGARRQVVVVAAQRDAIDRVLAAVRGAGLRAEGIDLSAFALIRALYRVTPDRAGVTLYASVGGVTNIAIALRTDCLFTRVTSNGIEAMADELAGDRGLTIDQARQVLTAAGSTVDDAPVSADDQIDQAVRRIVASGARRIADDVRASLEFYGARDGAEPVTRVVLAGPGAGHAALAEQFARELGIEVERAGLVHARPDAFSQASVSPETFAVAAGLAVMEVPA